MATQYPEEMEEKSSSLNEVVEDENPLKISQVKSTGISYAKNSMNIIPNPLRCRERNSLLVQSELPVPSSSSSLLPRVAIIFSRSPSLE